MGKTEYEKAQEFASRMSNHPLLVTLREAQENIRKSIRDMFDGLKDENDALLFNEDEKFDLNNDDICAGLTLEGDDLQVVTELEDGEEWNMDLRDLSTENLVDIFHILMARKKL